MTPRGRPSVLALVLIVALSALVLAAAFVTLGHLSAPDPADAPLWAFAAITS